VLRPRLDVPGSTNAAIPFHFPLFARTIPVATGQTQAEIREVAMARAKPLRKFEMSFEPMTIEHLGLRLYSTLPPVISTAALVLLKKHREGSR